MAPMPKQPRPPRTPRGNLKPWPSVSAAQWAVLRLSAKEFRQLFGAPVPRGWRLAWLNRLNELLPTEVDARAAAQDFARYSTDTAKARAAQVLRAHGADPTAKPWSLEELGRLPPVAASLFMYLVGDYEEAFVLDGKAEEVIIPQRPSVRKPWSNLKSLAVLSENEAEIVTQDGKRHVVKYTTKRERLRTGVKWDRSADAGALPDITTLDGFVIANFERLTYDAGPAEPFAMQPDSARRYDTFYATDRELAVLSAILCPSAVAVGTQDITHGITASTLLDQHRHKLSNKRKRFGYLETVADQQILREKQNKSSGRKQATGRVKITAAERRRWIGIQMQRPTNRPVVPWPR